MMKVKNGFLLRVFEPEVSGDAAVVLIDFAVSILPVVELAGPESHPVDDSFGWSLSTLGSVVDVIDD